MEKDQKKNKKSGKKFWFRLTLFLLLFPLFLFSLAIGIIYFKQDDLIQEFLTKANEDFEGSIKIRESHIEPFAAFPYISIDFEDFHIYESKIQTKESEITHINHCYVDFNIWDILNADYKIKGVKLTKGSLRLIQHKDGSFNISNALKSKKPAEEVNEDFKIDLKSISMVDLDIVKINEEKNIIVDAFVDKAHTKVKSSNDHFYLDLDAKFKLTIVQSGDTTFIKNKHFEVATELDVNDLTKTLTVQPTVVKFENSSFGFSGKVGLEKDVPIDFHFNGEKPNFDLIIAVAPEEIAETFRQFDNQGKVFFKADIKGKSANGNMPEINATFGCENAFFNNKQTKKKLDKIGFKGSFTNGKNRDLSTMKLEIQQFSARPEAGVFSGNISVENFNSLDINIQLISDFDLDFIAKFVNARELSGLAGKVKMTMNFRDIIDLKRPEKAVEKLNESYFTQLEIENLRFDSPNLPAPIRDVDMKATLTGHAATIEYFNTQIGNTDLHITGSVSDLPAIIHHTNIPVTCDLNIESKKIDLQQLTKSKTEVGVDEQIDNLKLNLQFTSSAKKILKSKNLPEGEFFVKNFNAKLKHNSHAFHDFHADLVITEKDLNVIDFRGFIDQSDFHINGFLRNYDAVINNTNAPVTCEINIESKKIDLQQLTRTKTFAGFDEQIDNLKLDFQFTGSAKKILESKNLPEGEFFVKNFNAKLKHYPHAFHDFHADVAITEKDLNIIDFRGFIDQSDFHINGFLRNYDLWLSNAKNGETFIEFDIDSKKLKFDNLFAYGGENYVPEDYRHEEIDNFKFHGISHLYFNHGIFSYADFKLSNFTGKMKIHPLKFENFSTKIRLEPNSIDVQNFTGKMGHSDFNVDLHYNFHNGKQLKKNRLSIVSQILDVDELSNYNPPPTDSLTQAVDHDAAFSLYDLPFSDMDFSLRVGSLIYHTHTLENFSAKFHTSKDHMVHIDQLDFVTAEGEMKIKGYLSGKDKKHIYFSPEITVNHVDIDKLMLKFDNFGQDHLVSENIHGYFNGTITGKIHLHADLIPKIDDSKIVINMTITEGGIEKFAPLSALETYFEDKNVSKIRFDTLRNEITFDRGTITIPRMTINSTLGFLEISGTQIMNESLDMDYEIGVPWKMIGNVAANKLFRRNKKDEEAEDEIQYRKENSKFIYVTVKGGIEDFKVNVGKRKKRG